jgi:hypothetical protein
MDELFVICDMYVCYVLSVICHTYVDDFVMFHAVLDAPRMGRQPEQKVF